MPEYLILRLQGVMQSWGKHTYEDYRPSELFPTRSALSGLLAACCGIERENSKQLQALDASYIYTARLDQRKFLVERIFDYHTVQESIRATGAIRTDPIQTYREYLYDAHYTLALSQVEPAAFSLREIAEQVQNPVFTPFLGRKSCPLTSPLFSQFIEAENSLKALAQIQPGKGVIYSEEHASPTQLAVRDKPVYGRHRQFQVRQVYLHVEEEHHVFESI